MWVTGVQTCALPICENSPTVIDFDDFTVSYAHFHNSYKPRGDVSEEVMCAYGIMSNHEEKENVTTSSKCTKYIFSPYLSVSFFKAPIHEHPMISTMH